MRSPLRIQPVGRQGAALIVVLFFILLLSVVVVALLSRSSSAIWVAHGSAGEGKAGLLATSASEIVVGDLRQEIIAGSTNISTAPDWPVYLPINRLSMIPQTNGVPAGTDIPIPNLVSRSVRPGNTAGPSPYLAYPTYYNASLVPPNRAADDPVNPVHVSTTTPSTNGRYVSLARWNSHYLIPRASPDASATGSKSIDSTPISSFVAPDWVIVTRSGARSVTWNSNLADASVANTNYAVGRYAYAIYNEGGLLDANVAGYPADPTASGGPNGLSATQVGSKKSLALSDLSKLPISTSNTSPAFSQAQINNLVGWRNYASAQMTSANGSYGNFSFTPPAPSHWLTNFAASTNSFLNVMPPPAGVTTPPTDQALLSRQQLIKLTQSLGISQDSLQYLGTFERALEQPSAAPDPARPLIIGGTVPPIANGNAPNNADSYLGNNDAVGGDNTVNPALLSIRALQPFTRWNGSLAVVGEPLVKTKFALSRLAIVAYNATNATVKTASATTSDPDPVYDRFGLKRTNTSSPWVYDHGIHDSSGKVRIGTLSDVAAANREPDFIELLKAAIIAGSLGKAGPNLSPNSYSLYQYTLDSSIDYQILQIAANLIDQADTDSFPTQIQMTSGSVTHVFSGDEDLPSVYRVHLFSVVTKLPSPLLSYSNSITFSDGTGTPAFTRNGTTGSQSWSATTGGTAHQMASGTLNTPGQAAILFVPDVWNPHDPNIQAANSSLRPVNFRIVASTTDPLGLTPYFSLGTVVQFNAPNEVFPGSANPSSIPAPWATTTSALQFQDDAGAAFREPTLLWRPNAPTGVNLTAVGPASDVGPVKDANTGLSYLGFITGMEPISIQVNYTSTPPQPSDGNYVLQANTANITQSTPLGSYAQFTLSMQYQDNSGNWITYDSKYSDFHGLDYPQLIVNPVDFPNNSWMNPLQNAQFPGQVSAMDPRTARFSVGTHLNLANPNVTPAGSTFLLEPNANIYFASNSPSSNLLIKNDPFSIIESNRPRADVGDVTFYSNPCMTTDPGRNVQMRWFSGTEYRSGSGTSDAPFEYDGLWSQNNPKINVPNQKGNPAPLYYEDADGVARRAMGAYATTAVSASGSDNTAAHEVGMPEATAVTFASDNGIGTYAAAANAQTQSRPLIINRPFRNVGEMSYAFRGTPWKNIDFFTPESGDTALLDTFCINEPPANAMVAGKVDLNTRQAPVIAAIAAGADYDEVKNIYTTTGSTPPSYVLPPLSATEATNVGNALVNITSDNIHAWRGPLANVSELVGRYIANPGSIGTATDLYSYLEPVTNKTYVYAGLSAALDSTVYTAPPSQAGAKIQRFRESAIRPLAAAGQVRVWNLLIDIVAQSGRYPPSAKSLDQFYVDGEKHVWLHVAIDRLTGAVIDSQVEVVTP